MRLVVVLILLMLMCCYVTGACQSSQNGRYCSIGRKLNGLRSDSLHKLYWVADTSCKGYYSTLAEEDIASGTAKLLGQDGWGVRKYPYDSIFERKYGVKYLIAGCALMEGEDCLTIYNRKISKYLDREYGRKWRRHLRPNIFGLEKRHIFHTR